MFAGQCVDGEAPEGLSVDAGGGASRHDEECLGILIVMRDEIYVGELFFQAGYRRHTVVSGVAAPAVLDSDFQLR